MLDHRKKPTTAPQHESSGHKERYLRTPANLLFYQFQFQFLADNVKTIDVPNYENIEKS